MFDSKEGLLWGSSIYHFLFLTSQIRAIDKNIKLYECMKFSEKKLILEVNLAKYMYLWLK